MRVWHIAIPARKLSPDFTVPAYTGHISAPDQYDQDTMTAWVSQIYGVSEGHNWAESDECINEGCDWFYWDWYEAIDEDTHCKGAAFVVEATVTSP